MRKIFLATAIALVVPAAASAQKVGTTRQQVNDRAAKRFAKLDADGNGQVTSAELTTAMKARASASGKAFRPKLVNRTMKMNDADNNGSISLQEFQNAAGARFDRLDTNKNGSIDEGEQPRGGAE
jgi:Ca2+-binding EF-hand superfamily protein